MDRSDLDDLDREARATQFAELVLELERAKEKAEEQGVPWCVVRSVSQPGYIAASVGTAREHGYQPLFVIEPKNSV